MKPNFLGHLRLFHFLLVVPIAAAFLCGRYFPATVSPKNVPPVTVAPSLFSAPSQDPALIAFDFRIPVAQGPAPLAFDFPRTVVFSAYDRVAP
jgi:hypothetical protein